MKKIILCISCMVLVVWVMGCSIFPENSQRLATYNIERSAEESGKSIPQTFVTFYDNGRVKSEERILNGKIVYGIYYAPDGRIVRRVGQR